jgi:peptidoglycan/LPS O-acetylase OafA/YrhL
VIQQAEGGSAGDTGARAIALPRLTSLRAFAALFVFAFHLGRWTIVGVGPFDVGYSGVAFFFVLSGFILTYTSASSGRALDMRRFYGRRFARVYPSHLVMLLAAIVVPVVAVDRTPLAATGNVLLVQSWFPAGTMHYGMNGVSWSLSCEALFYALFPLLFFVLRDACRRSLLLGLGVVLVTQVAIVIGGSLGSSYADYVSVFPPLQLGAFVLGILVARVALADRLLPAWGMAALAAASILACVELPTGRPDAAVWLLPLFAVLIAWAYQADHRGRPGLLRSRALVYAGEVSFAFYLVHELVIINLRHEHVAHGWWLALVALLVSSACAVTLHHLVERPAQRWLSGLFDVRSTVAWGAVEVAAVAAES